MKTVKINIITLLIFFTSGGSFAIEANSYNNAIYIGNTIPLCILEIIGATTSAPGLRIFTSKEPTTILAPYQLQ